ncbi:hypothetical protein A33K_13972 [Burkholderia humptydooensis MSMB43]|uniref:Uncharacterized protein n=1 Tax=Burkholderia humptydooensis MSMB43 TaxID=441157 RepID=A0ABN0GE00_9BURK|nr:hypothetical protein A33K_13972 [Burkholderia humptydooensis MSMB43]
MEELLDLCLKAHGLLSHLDLPVDCVNTTDGFDSRPHRSRRAASCCCRDARPRPKLGRSTEFQEARRFTLSR